MKKSFAFVMAFLIFAMPIVLAQPFGLKMGMTLEELKAKGCNPRQLAGETIRYFVSPPNPHYLFDTYIVSISKNYGTFIILAISKNIETSKYGSEIMNQYLGVRKQLNMIYGKSRNIDFVSPKSVWKDWMASLLAKERSLSSYWSREDGSDMPDDLRRISLESEALSTTVGYLKLQYESIDADKAMAGIMAEQGSVF